MKLFPILLIIPLIIASGCATASNAARHPIVAQQTGEPTKPGQRMIVRTTAYTHSEAGGHRNGVDGRLRFGGDVYSAATDWSWMPLGTRFRICSSGRNYVVEDYGLALVGRRTIDLYVSSRRDMNAWGVKKVEIEILELGSHIMSLKLLEGRMKNSHVRRMVMALRSQKPQAP
ncbi:MAG: 3d domain [Chthoniobacteraceae bacterium]|nr:3d domain [Chthoniobacteraceae bacterium]